MVTEQVEKSLEDKSPITRGSESYERTFEIEAIDQRGGIQSYITDIQIKERYAAMHYDLRWSSSRDRSTPFVGNPTKDKTDIRYEKNCDDVSRRVPSTVKPNHEVAVVFETINGDTYHMNWNIDFGRSELLDALFCDIHTNNISQDQPVDAMYEPKSDTDGTLSIKLNGTNLSDNRKVYKGHPDEEYKSNSDLINSIESWFNYCDKVQNDNEWVECPVINAYEDEDGEEISLIVENPLGEASSFEFEVTPDKSSPYWTVLNDIAQGDPANLSDSENTVLLRHRSRSFHNLSVSEHRKIIHQKKDIVSIDVGYEWEMKTDVESIDTKAKNNIKRLSLINKFLETLKIR